MKILASLLEMDPLMRPIGGPVPPHNLPSPPEQEDPPASSRTCPMCSQSTCGCTEYSGEDPLTLTAYLRFRDAAEEEERITSEEDEEALCNQILDFLKNQATPSEDDIESLAQSCGMDVEEVMTKIYEIARAFVVSVGKHSDMSDEEFDPEQLKMGIEVEKEHTKNPSIAKMIAKDHLNEVPDYYSRLKKVEQSAKQGPPEQQ